MRQTITGSTWKACGISRVVSVNPPTVRWIFDAANGTPTLAQLQAYNEVFAFSNNGWNNATGMGDVLADYEDAGGIVVVGTFAYDNRGPWLLAGRWMTGGYTAFNPSAVTNFSSASLETTQPPKVCLPATRQSGEDQHGHAAVHGSVKRSGLRAVRTRAERQANEAGVGDGRVRQHASDVGGLSEGAKRAPQDRQRADPDK